MCMCVYIYIYHILYISYIYIRKLYIHIIRYMYIYFDNRYDVFINSLKQVLYIAFFLVPWRLTCFLGAKYRLKS